MSTEHNEPEDDNENRTENDWQDFLNGDDNEGNDGDGGEGGDDDSFGDFEGPEINYTSFDESSEVFATISESFELHNGTASVQLRCRWEDRYGVVANFLEGGMHGEPMEYPREWNNSSGTPMVASSVRIEPMQTPYKAAGQAIEYEYALITLNYSMLATELRVESTNQYMTVAPTALFWQVNGAMVPVAQDEAPGVRLASYDLTLSHPHIKCYTEDGSPIQSYEGFCNDSDISIEHNGVSLHFPRQTLLCTAPSISAGANLFGSGFNNVSIRLSYNPLGHNEFFNPMQGDGENISDITAHKVQLFKKIGGTDSNSSNSGNSGSTGETGEFQRVIIYPEKDFIPLFRAFKLHRVESSSDYFGDISGVEVEDNNEEVVPADLGIDDGYHNPNDNDDDDGDN